MSGQWCDRHWARIRDAMTGPLPVNGLLVMMKMTQAWMESKGTALPGPREAARINALILADSPLCCHLGEEWFEQACSDSIVPERYRDVDPQVGHQRHLREVAELDGRRN